MSYTFFLQATTLQATRTEFSQFLPRKQATFRQLHILDRTDFRSSEFRKLLTDSFIYRISGWIFLLVSKLSILYPYYMMDINNPLIKKSRVLKEQATLKGVPPPHRFLKKSKFHKQLVLNQNLVGNTIKESVLGYLLRYSKIQTNQ